MLSCPRPKIYELKCDGTGFYPIQFEGEGFGPKPRAYMEKFAAVYNNLITKEKSYLMHPARRTDLVNYLAECLETKFSNTELAADRLITYHCFGEHGLEIAEVERATKKYSKELDEALTKLTDLSKSEPKFIKNGEELCEEDLLCISDDFVRMNVCRIYKALAQAKKLDCLKLPAKELYDYDVGDKCRAHQDLAPFAKVYKEENNGSSYHFGAVVTYLQTLADSDLNGLLKHCLDKEVSILQLQKNFLSEQLAILNNQSLIYQYRLGVLNRTWEPQKKSP